MRPEAQSAETKLLLYGIKFAAIRALELAIPVKRQHAKEEVNDTRGRTSC